MNFSNLQRRDGPVTYGRFAPRRPFLARWLVRLGVIVLIFTLVGLLEAGQSLMMQFLSNRPASGWRTLVVALADWYIWAALTPFVLFAAQVFSLGQRDWPLSLFLHVVLSLVC